MPLAFKKPYAVVITLISGDKVIPFESDNPRDCEDYCRNNVCFCDRVFSRIALHDRTGSLETFWDSSWK